MNNKELEVLNTAKEYIEKLISGINEVVGYIQSGKEKQAIEMIPLIAEGIGYIIDVIEVLNIEIDKDKTIGNLNGQLGEIVDGIENNDYILIADILNYEIVPIMDKIKIVLNITN